jgi:site-specific DNA-methyltransferase (adenine-specific)
MSRIALKNEDCLVAMDRMIEEGVKVDAIITDPPYGTTACKWDSVIDFDEMWKRLNKLIKPNGAIVLFGSEPFSSALRMSNIKNYKYDWKWNKVKSTGHLNSKKQPLRKYEDIMIFYKKQCLYNPQMEDRGRVREDKPRDKIYKGDGNQVYGTLKATGGTYTDFYPDQEIKISNASQKGKVHPTQKPIALMEYLIKTYTNDGELVLDFTMGSGTTGVACKNTGRSFIGIELDENYFNIATERLD